MQEKSSGEKELWIIRHGETDFNRSNIIQGSGIDSDLNENGMLQSQLFFSAYAEEKFDHIFISELKRTQQTIQPFIDVGFPFSKHAELNELSWGEFEGVPIEDHVKEIFFGILTEWKSGNTHVAPRNGDSPESLQEKQKRFLNLIDQYKGEKFLICLHGRALRIFLCTLLGKNLSEMETFPHQNLSLSKITGTSGKYHAEILNDISHLQPQYDTTN